MGTVDWAVLCDVAYFDACRNLCLIGMQTEAVPTFAIGTRRFAIAARVPGLGPRPEVAVTMTPPDAGAAVETSCERIAVEAAGDYLLLAIGASPLLETGVHRVEITVNARDPISFDMPLVIAAHQ